MAAAQKHSVFVGNMPRTMTDAGFGDFLANLNVHPSSRRFLNDKMTGEFKGVAFLDFASQEEADNAISALNGVDCDGQQLKSNPARSANDRSTGGFGGPAGGAYGGGYGGGYGAPSMPVDRAARGIEENTVFVANLPWSADEAQIRDVFSQAGQVTEVRLLYDRETSRPRGMGYVEFTDADAANKAIRELAGQDFNGRTMRVDHAHKRDTSRVGGAGGAGGAGGPRGGYQLGGGRPPMGGGYGGPRGGGFAGYAAPAPYYGGGGY